LPVGIVSSREVQNDCSESSLSHSLPVNV